MSIYPVRAKNWWKLYKNMRKDMRETIEIEKTMIQHDMDNGNIQCCVCGKTIKTMAYCYLSHGYCYGFTDNNYCTKKCFNKEA